MWIRQPFQPPWGRLAAIAAAQSYKILHTFKGNPDGADPDASVVIGKDGALYGTTYLGGTYKSGTVFQLKKVGGQPWEETVLHSFGPPPVEGATSDDSYPRANLVFGMGQHDRQREQKRPWRVKYTSKVHLSCHPDDCRAPLTRKRTERHGLMLNTVPFPLLPPCEAVP